MYAALPNATTEPMSETNDDRSVTTHREDGTVIAISAGFVKASKHFDAIHSKARREFGSDIKITKDDETRKVVFSAPGLGSPTAIL